MEACAFLRDGDLPHPHQKRYNSSGNRNTIISVFIQLVKSSTSQAEFLMVSFTSRKRVSRQTLAFKAETTKDAPRESAHSMPIGEAK